MKNRYFKTIVTIVFLGMQSLLFSQNVSINNSGNAAYVSAILDLSNNNTAGNVGFLPPYATLTALGTFGLSGTPAQSNGIVVYCTGLSAVPAGLYYWNNSIPSWVPMGGSLTGAGTLNYLARWTPNGTTLGIGVTQDNGASVAMNTTATAPVASQMLTATGNATAINAIVGTTAFSGGSGVEGIVTNPSSLGGYGVKGVISGAGGGFQYALYGASTVTAGDGYGVYGTATGAATINYGGYFAATGATTNYGVVVPAASGNSGFGTATPVSTLDDAGSFGTGTYNFTTGINGGGYFISAMPVASTYIVTPPATGSFNLTLPSPVTNPRQIYTIVYYGVGLGTIDIVSAANSIYQNGAIVAPCPLTGGILVLQSDGANYQVITNNGIVASSNGLSTVGTTVQLGGSNLIHATNIPLNGNTLAVTGTSVTTTFAATGQVGVGNAVPNAKAVVDLTNATNLGLMLPGMTTANLPGIGPAQNGLIVFNTTIGCPEYAENSVWIAIGAQHGTANFVYTGGIQVFTIPPCINSVTITASGAAGGTNDFGGGNGTTFNEVFTVVSGHTLDIVVGGMGQSGIWDGGGGGGGSFVWDNASTNYPLIVAGGGGGGGYTGAGANASTTITPTASAGGCGAGGAGGAAGAEGLNTKPGAAGGGTGWNTITGLPAAATATVGQGGVGEPSAFAGGAGATGGITICAGGYGGGGGGGYNTTSTYGTGGGGGGYNGGGGGNCPSNANQYGGGGGGSGYYNSVFPYTTAADFVSATAAAANNSGNGYVSILY